MEEQVLLNNVLMLFIIKEAYNMGLIPCDDYTEFLKKAISVINDTNN